MWTMLAGVPGKLKTMLDRLTATRAANLDKLDANVSTRAAASTALSNAVWTDARAGKLDLIGIKSIQRGSFTWGAAETTRSITISSVTASRAILTFSFTSKSGATSFGEGERESFVAGNVDSDTALRFSREESGHTPLVEWQLIEYF